MSFGAAAAVLRGAGSRTSRRRTAVRATEIAVKEKTETKPVSYLDTIPRTIIDKPTLDKMLSLVPKEEWEDPPEDSILYLLKLYSETYGEGKATKMGWWDFWYLTINRPDADEFKSGEELAMEKEAYMRILRTGQIPMQIPGPGGTFH